MKKFILSFIFQSIMLLNIGYSQSFTLYGDKVYGGLRNDRATNMIYLNSNEIILVGYSDSDVSGNKADPLCVDTANIIFLFDIWVVKTDLNFNIIWQKSIGGTNKEILPNISKINDELFAIGAISQSDSSCEKSQTAFGVGGTSPGDYWVCVMDTAGNFLWDRQYGGLGSETICNIKKLSSGEFIIGGISGPGQIGGNKNVPNFGSSDFWVVKTDSVGNKIWEHVYGGTGQEASQTLSYQSIYITNSGSIVIFGATNSALSGTITDPPFGGFDILMTEIDTSGNVIWDHTYGGSGYDVCSSITECTNGGFMLVGYTYSPMDGDISEPSKGLQDCLFVRTDSLGNMLWNRRFGGTNDEALFKVIEDIDGGFLGIGVTCSPVSFDISEPPIGICDYWVIKIDSTGNKVWDKRLGSPGADRGMDILQLADSSYILFGVADSGISATKTDIGYGGEDYWMVHMKYNDSTTSISESWQLNGQINIYPNPTNNILHLDLLNSMNIESIRIIDGAGKVIRNNFSKPKNTIDVSELASGVYIIEGVSDSEIIFRSKFSKY